MAAPTSFDDIGKTLDAHLGDGVSDLCLAEGRRRFVEGISHRMSAVPSARRQQLLPLISLVGAGLVSIAAVVLVVVDRGRVRQQLAARQSATSHASFVEASGEVLRLETSRDQSGATVQLVSGASVTLSRRTRGESRLVAPRSYRVRLDYGEMTFTIDPHAGATWIVDVGAYQVRVIGTVFTVNRDPARELVQVHVDRGRVEISGMGYGGGGLDGKIVTLGPGGVLHAAGNDLRIEEPSQGTVAAPSAPPFPSVPGGARGGQRLVAGLATQREVARDWMALYDAGEYPAAWRIAQGAGYGRLVGTLDVTRLSHLADAARLAGDSGGARAVLVALRRRFPDAREAAEAAFLLGRLAADAPGGLSEAATWFESYVAEKPRGVHADEARGRLIVVHRRAGRSAEARRAARDYLARHRSGPYGAVAVSVLD